MEFNEIKYQDPRTRIFLGSPSLVRLPDGAFLVSHDLFGPGSPKNSDGKDYLSCIYRSEDRGASWRFVTLLAGSYWGSLFVHRGEVYLLGTSHEFGGIGIRRSSDGGFSWTPAELLFPGGTGEAAPNYHCAPVPVVAANGRLYRAFEDCDPMEWGPGFQSCVISAAADSDLLDVASWRMSNKLAFRPEWLPELSAVPTRPGWLEGNIVEGPAGELYNLLRFSTEPLSDKAALLKLSPDGGTLSVEPFEFLVDMPGGCHKFTVRRDPVTGFYLTLSSRNTVPKCAWQRNRLDLSASADLRNWFCCATIFADDIYDLDSDKSLAETGFQYADWFIDGDDLAAVVRVAYDGAPNFHDSNRIIFHRIRNFRRLLRTS